jgi:hypothetical protein
MAKCETCGTTGLRIRKDGDMSRHDCVTVPEDNHDIGGLIPTGIEAVNLSGEAEVVQTLDSYVPVSVEADEGVTTPDVIDMDQLFGVPQDQDVPVVEEEIPKAPKKNFYTFTLTVSHTCNYLNSASWHQSNAGLAASRAVAAGHSPEGEAKYVGSQTKGRKIVLTYEVPVK